MNEFAVVVNRDWKTAKFFDTVGFNDGRAMALTYYDDLCMKKKYKIVEMFGYAAPSIGTSVWHWDIIHTTETRSRLYRNVAKKRRSATKKTNEFGLDWNMGE